MKHLSMLAAFFVLGACATVGPTSYGPADSNGFGYESTQIESDRHRISYQGSGDMPPEMVEDFALLRAGEIALAKGFDWFRVVSRDMAAEEKGGVGIGAGFGTGSYGRRSSVGVGVGGDLGTVGGRTYFTVRMEVLMGRGDPPEDGQYYGAREIVDTIGGRI